MGGSSWLLGPYLSQQGRAAWSTGVRAGGFDLTWSLAACRWGRWHLLSGPGTCLAPSARLTSAYVPSFLGAAAVSPVADWLPPTQVQREMHGRVPVCPHPWPVLVL